MIWQYVLFSLLPRLREGKGVRKAGVSFTCKRTLLVHRSKNILFFLKSISNMSWFMRFKQICTCMHTSGQLAEVTRSA